MGSDAQWGHALRCSQRHGTRDGTRKETWRTDGAGKEVAGRWPKGGGDAPNAREDEEATLAAVPALGRSRTCVYCAGATMPTAGLPPSGTGAQEGTCRPSEALRS